MSPVPAAYLSNVALFAHDLGNGIPPILIALILQEPLLLPGDSRSRWRSALAFWWRAALAIAAASLIAQLGKEHEVWPGRPGFPSGHMSFSSAAIVSLIFRRGPRWWGLLGPIAVVMAWSLVRSGAHSLVEIAGGTMLGCLLALVLNLPRRKA